MLITLKTLQQKVFKVEVELSESVSELKEKVAKVGKEDHGGEYPTDKQKLIFQVNYLITLINNIFNKVIIVKTDLLHPKNSS